MEVSYTRSVLGGGVPVDEPLLLSLAAAFAVEVWVYRYVDANVPQSQRGVNPGSLNQASAFSSVTHLWPSRLPARNDFTSPDGFSLTDIAGELRFLTLRYATQVPTMSNPTDDALRADPERMRAFADRLELGGDYDMARAVRQAADEVDAFREGAHLSRVLPRSLPLGRGQRRAST